MGFKDDLQKYLDETGEKPYKLAKRAGVGIASVYDFINGEKGLRLANVEKLQEAMKTPPDCPR